MIISTLWTNLAIQAITFATSVLTARILGPVGRGELALVLLYPQLVAVVTLLGTDRAVAVLAGRRELARPVLTASKLVLLLSPPAVGLGYAFVKWRVADAHLADLATLYLGYVPAVYFFMLISFVFNGTGDFLRFNLVRLGFYVVNLGLLLAVWLAVPNEVLDYVVAANLASVFGALALAALLLRGFGYSANPSASSPTADLRNVLQLTLAFALPGALTQLSGSAYQIILEHRLGVGPLGLFVVYFSYSRVLSPIGNAIASHVFYHGIAGQNRDIARISRMSLVTYVVSCLPLWLLAQWLIPLVFGSGFVADSWAIALLLISCLFAMLADSLAEFLKGHKKVQADVWGRTIYVVVVAVLGWWLAPSLGLVGMGLAMALADALRFACLVTEVGRFTEQLARKFWQVDKSDISALISSGRKSFARLRVRR